MKHLTIAVPFSVTVRRSDTSDDYIAHCPTLDLDAHGDTISLAGRALADRMFAMFDRMAAMREPRPSPTVNSVPAEADLALPSVTAGEPLRTA